MKNRTTYKILTIIALIIPFPFNRIYLGEKGIFWRCLTLNWFWFGSFADLFYMDKRFDEAMAQRGFINTKIRDQKRN